MPRPAAKMTISHQAHVQKLHEKVKDLEKQIASCDSHAARQSGGDDPSNRLRLPLCEAMADLIMTDPAFSAQNKIADRMWRACFYSRILPWRGKIEKDKKRGVDTRRIEESLNVFLNEGVTLYKYLIDKLQAKLAKKFGMHVAEDSSGTAASESQASFSVAPPGSEITDGVVSLLAACHLCLGDLLRYAKDLGHAESAYRTASALAPGFGHAFNQLAVVCQLKEQQGSSPLSAVAFYWYTRALLVSMDPFTTAKSNLTRLLASNHEWLKTQSESRDRSKSKSAQTRGFLGMFVDLQYSFFQGIDENSMEKLTNQIQSVIDRFRGLLEMSAFGDSLLCRMVVMQAFSELYLDRPKGIPSKTTMVLARVATYQFGTCLTDRVMVGLSKVAEGKLPSSVRLLLPVLLLTEYTAAVSMPESENDFAKEQLANATRTFWRGMISIWNKLSQMVPPEMLEETPSELKAFVDLRGFGPFGFLPPCQDGLLSDEEALHELMQSTSKTDKPNDTASTGTSASGAAADQGRLKLARLRGLADKLMEDTSGTIGRYINKDEGGNFVWFENGDDEAEDDHVASEPMDVEPQEGKDEDMLVYKTGADGGPALLVPGMLLQGENPSDMASTTPPKKLPTSPDNLDQSVASERLPVFDATPVNLQQHSGTPLAMPYPTESSLGTPAGAAAFIPPTGVRLPPGLDSGVGLLSPPPGFGAAAPAPPVRQPETIGEALRLYGDQLQTANPFADPPLGLSSDFPYSAPSAPIGANFLGTGHGEDPMAMEGTTLLDSGLLNSLWLDDSHSKTKNPFAT